MSIEYLEDEAKNDVKNMINELNISEYIILSNIGVVCILVIS